MPSSASPPLLPAPVHVERHEGAFRLRAGQPICVPPAPTERAWVAAQVLREGLEERAGVRLSLESPQRPTHLGPHIALRLDSKEGGEPSTSRASQAYRLQITSQAVTLSAASESGLRHGVETLLQWVDGRGRLPCGWVQDAPQLARRGLMLDISRGKVPRTNELRRLVRLCARLKLNVLMLYTEHTFRFRRHPEIGAEAAPLSAETLRALDCYAWQHGVELVPCLQSLGHMEHVLELPRYRSLAESDLRWSLAPSDPATYALLEDLYDEYLPNFRSRLFNANCDEPWDLGHGRSAQLAKELGRDGLYLRHLERVQQLAHRHDKRTMVWGDVLRSYPASIEKLDREVVVLDWWYEAQWSYDRVQQLAERGLTFWVCPGTAGWNALFPRVDNSLANISGWAEAARQHGAEGLLLTDWGDFGHYNLQSNSYLAFAWAAQESWSGPVERASFDRAFDRLFFGALGCKVASLYRALGSLHDVGFAIPNGSPLSFLFFDPLETGTFVRRARDAALSRTRKRLWALRRKLDALQVRGEDAAHTLRELEYALEASCFAVDKALAGLAYHGWLSEPKLLNAAGRRRLAAGLEALAERQRALGRRLWKLWRVRAEAEGFEYTQRRLNTSMRGLRSAARRLTRNAPRPAPALAPLTLQQAVQEVREAMRA